MTGTQHVRAVQVGDMAPDFALVDTEEQAHHLQQTAAKQAVIIVFYRGDW